MVGSPEIPRNPQLLFDHACWRTCHQDKEIEPAQYAHEVKYLVINPNTPECDSPFLIKNLVIHLNDHNDPSCMFDVVS